MILKSFAIMLNSAANGKDPLMSIKRISRNADSNMASLGRPGDPSRGSENTRQPGGPGAGFRAAGSKSNPWIKIVGLPRNAIGAFAGSENSSMFTVNTTPHSWANSFILATARGVLPQPGPAITWATAGSTFVGAFWQATRAIDNANKVRVLIATVYFR